MISLCLCCVNPFIICDTESVLFSKLFLPSGCARQGKSPHEDLSILVREAQACHPDAFRDRKYRRYARRSQEIQGCARRSCDACQKGKGHTARSYRSGVYHRQVTLSHFECFHMSKLMFNLFVLVSYRLWMGGVQEVGHRSRDPPPSRPG